jgi:hypothetical protein
MVGHRCSTRTAVGEGDVTEVLRARNACRPSELAVWSAALKDVLDDRGQASRRFAAGTSIDITQFFNPLGRT